MIDRYKLRDIADTVCKLILSFFYDIILNQVPTCPGSPKVSWSRSFCGCWSSCYRWSAPLIASKQHRINEGVDHSYKLPPGIGCDVINELSRNVVHLRHLHLSMLFVCYHAQWLADVHAWNVVWCWSWNESDNCHYSDGAAQDTASRRRQNWCVTSWLWPPLLARIIVVKSAHFSRFCKCQSYSKAVLFPNVLQRNTFELNVQICIFVRHCSAVVSESQIIEDVVKHYLPVREINVKMCMLIISLQDWTQTWSITI